MTKREIAAASAGAAMVLVLAATAVLGVQDQHTTEHLGIEDATHRAIARCESKAARALDVVSREGSPRVVDDSGDTIKIVSLQKLRVTVDCVAPERPDTTPPDTFILFASVDDEGVYLAWTDDIPEDVTQIAPVRSDTGEPGTFVNVTSGSLPASARSYTDATVVAGETYWYRLRWKHGSGSSATYSVTSIVRADIPPDTTERPDTIVERPDPTTPPDTVIGEAGVLTDPLPTNEPAGMTLIGSTNGTVKEANGNAFGINGFGRWSDGNTIEVVDDLTNPVGSGKSLRFRWRPKVHPSAGIARMRGGIPGGPYQEMYIRWRLILEAGGWDAGHKFFYLARHAALAEGSTATDRPSGGTPRPLRIIGSGFHTYSHNPSYGSTAANEYPLRIGEWFTAELHIRRETPGTTDGFVRMWVNGDLVAERLNLDIQSWADGENFNYFEWYGNANSVPTESFYRLGELYISGKRQ